MTDFEYLNTILHSRYRENTSYLIEDKGDNLSPQIAEITHTDLISDVAVYRLDADIKGDFLPFFHNGNTAPKALRKFCDYILLAAHRDGTLAIILVEMKRGDTEDAEEQIKASELFVDYLLNTAERIKKANGQPGFCKEDVAIRRVILREAHSNKRATRPKEITAEAKAGIIDYRTTRRLPLHYLL